LGKWLCGIDTKLKVMTDFQSSYTPKVFKFNKQLLDTAVIVFEIWKRWGSSYAVLFRGPLTKVD